MIEKKTEFSQVECTKNGATQIRLEKQIVENGLILYREYHRTALEPGVTLDGQMAAVTAHLAQMGYPPPSAADVDRIRAIVDVEHTPAAVEKFRQAHEIPPAAKK